jgi:single-strand DNA-binding protein
VEGRLQTRGWEDNDGKKHYRTELVAGEMIMLGERQSNFNASASEASSGDNNNDSFAF